MKDFRIMLFLLVFAIIFNGPGNTDQLLIEPWEVDYDFSHMLPTDIVEDPANPGKGDNVPSPFNALTLINRNLPCEGNPPYEMTPDLRDSVLEALNETLNPDIVTGQLLNLVSLCPANLLCASLLDIWRSGEYSRAGFIFWVPFKIDNVRFLVFGALEDGLTETVIFKDAQNIDEFNTFVHNYLSIPSNDTAVNDYRPIRIRHTQIGYNLADPECDYAYVGYIITHEDETSLKVARSIERTYHTFDLQTEVQKTIEFSVRYTPRAD